MTDNATPTPEAPVTEAGRALLEKAEPDENFEGEYIDWLVPNEQIEALRAALAATPSPAPTDREADPTVIHPGPHRGCIYDHQEPDREAEVARELRRRIADLPEWTGHPAAAVQRVAVDSAIADVLAGLRASPAPTDRPFYMGGLTDEEFDTWVQQTRERRASPAPTYSADLMEASGGEPERYLAMADEMADRGAEVARIAAALYEATVSYGATPLAERLYDAGLRASPAPTAPLDVQRLAQAMADRVLLIDMVIHDPTDEGWRTIARVLLNQPLATPDQRHG